MSDNNQSNTYLRRLVDAYNDGRLLSGAARRFRFLGTARRLRRIKDFVHQLRLVRTRYERSYRELLSDFVKLRIHDGYTTREIFMYEHLNRELMEKKRRTAISKNRLRTIQKQLNPPHSARRVRDKSLFYLHCQDHKLPIPRLLAIWTPGGGRTAGGAPLRNDGDWVEFFVSLREPEIVIKPTNASHGRGIRFLRRSDAIWRDHNGLVLSASDILCYLRDNQVFDRFVIQERLAAHPSLVELSGTDYLQTVRVITGVTEGDHVAILAGEMKIICGEATISNFKWGSTGNAVSDVQLETGQLGSVFIARTDGLGLVPIERHPITDKLFDGFIVPFWHETRALCEQAALSVRPLRTVGWDVAASPHGPVLIEGNIFFDPHPSMGPFLQYAEKVLHNPRVGTGVGVALG